MLIAVTCACTETFHRLAFAKRSASSAAALMGVVLAELCGATGWVQVAGLVFDIAGAGLIASEAAIMFPRIGYPWSGESSPNEQARLRWARRGLWFLILGFGLQAFAAAYDAASC